VGQPTDLAATVELEQMCFEDPWPASALLGELMRDQLRFPLVVEVDGVLRGYLMSWRIESQLHILNIAVDPQWRRRGLAAALLVAAAQQASTWQLTEVTLEVRRSNAAARTFYSRFGLSEVGVRLRYYRSNGEDAIVMTGPVLRILAGNDREKPG